MNYPEWATDKQKEGMDIFVVIVDEYHHFDIEFKKSNMDEEEYPRFEAVVTWDSNGGASLSHEFEIGWNHEKVWAHSGEELDEWQFIFSFGDCAREMSTEIFYLDMFFFMDRNAIGE